MLENQFENIVRKSIWKYYVQNGLYDLASMFYYLIVA